MHGILHHTELRYPRYGMAQIILKDPWQTTRLLLLLPLLFKGKPAEVVILQRILTSFRMLLTFEFPFGSGP